MKKTTLSFLISPNRELLMIWKKTGQGKGKWNMPGGKVETGETAEAAAIRETIEETGLIPSELSLVGKLDFHFEAGGSWPSECSVFMAKTYTGSLQAENDECRALWVPIDEIPWDQMWESDREWIPLVLRGKFFHRRYFFDAKDRLLRSEVVA
jgi:8-oxo-dGTP diphosphatase